MVAGSKSNIILVGFMGTGKTTVGRALAKNLRRPFVDTDARLETMEELSVAQIFRTQGEGIFRTKERQVISQVCKSSGQVIATGGGAIVDQQNVNTMKSSGCIICLTARPEVLIRRLEGDHTRPLLRNPHPLERINALLVERSDAYAQADFSVDTSDQNTKLTVEAIKATLDRMNFPL